LSERYDVHETIHKDLSGTWRCEFCGLGFAHAATGMTPHEQVVDHVVKRHPEKLHLTQNRDEVLSEDWLLENLPEGWTYDCQFDPAAFTITATDGKTLTILLRLLKG